MKKSVCLSLVLSVLVGSEVFGSSSGDPVKVENLTNGSVNADDPCHRDDVGVVINKDKISTKTKGIMRVREYRLACIKDGGAHKWTKIKNIDLKEWSLKNDKYELINPTSTTSSNSNSSGTSSSTTTNLTSSANSSSTTTNPNLSGTSSSTTTNPNSSANSSSKRTNSSSSVFDYTVRKNTNTLSKAVVSTGSNSIKYDDICKDEEEGVIIGSDKINKEDRWPKKAKNGFHILSLGDADDITPYELVCSAKKTKNEKRWILESELDFDVWWQQSSGKQCVRTEDNKKCIKKPATGTLWGEDELQPTFANSKAKPGDDCESWEEGFIIIDTKYLAPWTKKSGEEHELACMTDFNDKKSWTRTFKLLEKLPLGWGRKDNKFQKGLAPKSTSTKIIASKDLLENLLKTNAVSTNSNPIDDAGKIFDCQFTVKEDSNNKSFGFWETAVRGRNKKKNSDAVKTNFEKGKVVCPNGEVPFSPDWTPFTGFDPNKPDEQPEFNLKDLVFALKFDVDKKRGLNGAELAGKNIKSTALISRRVDLGWYGLSPRKLADGETAETLKGYCTDARGCGGDISEGFLRKLKSCPMRSLVTSRCIQYAISSNWVKDMIDAYYTDRSLMALSGGSSVSSSKSTADNANEKRNVRKLRASSMFKASKLRENIVYAYILDELLKRHDDVRKYGSQVIRIEQSFQVSDESEALTQLLTEIRTKLEKATPKPTQEASNAVLMKFIEKHLKPATPVKTN